jgi:hypothetical protein
MNTSDPTGDWPVSADEPMDATDVALLARVHALYDATDPMPVDLVERIEFDLTLDALNAELAELQQLPAGELTARSADPDEVRTLTFTSDSLTTMINISAAGPDRVRIDGWLAPGGPAQVELRQVGGSQQTVADDDGRFVFQDVPHALTRFVIQSPGHDSRPPVVTPAVEL